MTGVVPASPAAALADRYTLDRELGAGGMATVYLAHDRKLERDVAIKVLHPDLGAALGGERFLSEIKTTAKLQHPHILPLLDSGAADGLLYYVMPFIDGETLRTRLERERQLRIDDAVLIAREVADALAYAHAQGVIHRDIKPENILLKDGHALVADFGIALAVTNAGGSRMTQTGLSLGTPQYMAPEQAMGERLVDARADVYALGAVTYEMLTGEPPFTGATVQAIVAKILTERPVAPTAVRDTVPAHVEAAVLDALAKNPADRLADARAFSEALRGMRVVEDRRDPSTAKHVGGVRSASTSAVRMWQLATGLAGAAALTAGALALRARDGALRSEPEPVFSTLVPASGEMWTNNASRSRTVLAPDGRSLVVTGSVGKGSGLLLRRLDSLSAELLPGTENAVDPFWAPDSRALGFFAGGKLKVIDLATRTVRSLCDATRHLAGSWGADSVILYVPLRDGGPLHRTTPAGGTCATVPLSRLPIGEFRVEFLGDGRHFLLASGRESWLGRVGDSTLTLLAARAGTGQKAVVAFPDWLLYSPEGVPDQYYHAQRIDVAARALTGPATFLVGRVNGGGGETAISSSTTGTLLLEFVDTMPRLLARFRDGRLVDSTRAPAQAFSGARVSWAGNQLVKAVFRIAVWDAPRNLWRDVVPLRAVREVTQYPLWSPGDSLIAVVRNDSLLAFRVADGTSRLITADTVVGRGIYLEDWSPDGRHIVYRYTGGEADEPWVLDVVTGTRRRLFAVDAPFRNARVSPDGRRLAYALAGADPGVYVRPFPGPGEAVRVLYRGIIGQPRWSVDGSRLYVLQQDRILRLMMAPDGQLATQPEVVLGRDVLDALAPDYADLQFDVAPRTEELFVLPGGTRQRQLTLLQHWPALLARRQRP